jgi:uncharacterized integral membrane protein
MSQESGGEGGRRDSTWTGRLIVAGIVLAILLFFVVLNSEQVEIDILIAETDMRLGWALLLAGALGFVAGFFMPRNRK